MRRAVIGLDSSEKQKITLEGDMLSVVAEGLVITHLIYNGIIDKIKKEDVYDEEINDMLASIFRSGMEAIVSEDFERILKESGFSIEVYEGNEK